MSSTARTAPTGTLRRPYVPLTVTRPRLEALAPWPPVRSPGGTVVILSATVGQGHEGAARELARRLRERGVDVAVHDYLDALPGPARRALRDLYSPTVQYAPRLFEGLFQRLEHDGLLRATAEWVCASAESSVAAWAAEADVVVTTYPLAGQTLGRLRDRGGLDARSVTYLTDPAAHRLWCHPSVDRHLTVTGATALDARRYDVDARAAGPLCAPAFGALDGISRAAARLTVREELGLPQDAPAVLIGAGSLGMGSVPHTVRDVLGHPGARVVVLCGRNDTLRRRLGHLPRVVALGWRDDVPALMAAADALVHNAGGLSFTEALVAGLPALTYRPIPGHGRANAEVLARAGIAAWPRSAAELVAAVDGLDHRGTTEWPPVEERAAPTPWPAGADPADSVRRLLARARAGR